VVEPLSAVTLAVVLKHPKQFKHLRVGLMLTGGNVDLADLPFKRPGFPYQSGSQSMPE